MRYAIRDMCKLNNKQFDCKLKAGNLQFIIGELKNYIYKKKREKKKSVKYINALSYNNAFIILKFYLF